MNRLRATIERAFADLSALEKPWAVVGGLAVSTYAEPRATRDLDVAIAVSGDDEAEQIIWSLLQLGYSVVAAVEQSERDRLATMRLQPPMKGAAIVDLLFASSGIEVEIAESAVKLEILPGLSAPVASIGHLIAMKVLARDDRRRRSPPLRPSGYSCSSAYFTTSRARTSCIGVMPALLPLYFAASLAVGALGRRMLVRASARST